jgi:hypothetical protein
VRRFLEVEPTFQKSFKAGQGSFMWHHKRSIREWNFWVAQWQIRPCQQPLPASWIFGLEHTLVNSLSSTLGQRQQSGVRTKSNTAWSFRELGTTTWGNWKRLSTAPPEIQQSS